MTIARVAGVEFELDRRQFEDAAGRLDPEPIREHYVVVAGRRFPPKQILAAVIGLDRADFTTHQARAILRRLGFGVHRRSRPDASPERPLRVGPHGGAEAALLEPFKGRWVAQDGLEVLFDAGSPEEVLHWLRRHRLQARVWCVPSSATQAGSALSSP
jgi:hypothetical protein